MLHRGLCLVFIQVELLIRPIAEDLGSHLYLVGPNVKITDNVLDKGQHGIVVVLSDTARGVEDEEDIGLGGACWCAGVLGF